MEKMEILLWPEKNIMIYNCPTWLPEVKPFNIIEDNRFIAQVLHIIIFFQNVQTKNQSQFSTTCRNTLCATDDCHLVDSYWHSNTESAETPKNRNTSWQLKVLRSQLYFSKRTVYNRKTLTETFCCWYLILDK